MFQYSPYQIDRKTKIKADIKKAFIIEQAPFIVYFTPLIHQTSIGFTLSFFHAIYLFIY